jgi:hypothetical protein
MQRSLHDGYLSNKGTHIGFPFRLIGTEDRAQPKTFTAWTSHCSNLSILIIEAAIWLGRENTETLIAVPPPA